MTTKQVIAAMSGGATLCMEYADGRKIYWLEPKRILIEADVAERVIGIPGVKPGGDTIFKDTVAQTWRVK
jgi:hypothetical protein